MITSIATTPAGVLGTGSVASTDAGSRVRDPAAGRAEPTRPDVSSIQPEDAQGPKEPNALKEPAPRPEINLRELSIRVLPETNRVVIEVIDSETKAVVRQIPPEDALDLLRHLPDHRAVLIDTEG